MDSITDICYDLLPNKADRIKSLYIEPLERQIEKLKTENQQYKNKLADGRMIELPCKVGNPVYQPTKRGFISTYKIRSIELFNEFEFYHWELIDGFYGNLVGFKNSEINKTVFLTREEAEKVLKDQGTNQASDFIDYIIKKQNKEREKNET